MGKSKSAMTTSKPFSFFGRELGENKKKFEEVPTVNTIRAKPIPMKSAVLLMESMKVKAEEKRNREHAERTSKLMQASKLPKRMEIHNNQLKDKPKDKAKSMLVKYMAKSVPDFAKLHAKFNAKMESGRKDFKGTEPTPFALNEGK